MRSSVGVPPGNVVHGRAAATGCRQGDGSHADGRARLPAWACHEAAAPNWVHGDTDPGGVDVLTLPQPIQGAGPGLGVDPGGKPLQPQGLTAAGLVEHQTGDAAGGQLPRSTGVWTSSVFIGQFVCPLIVLALSGAISGLTSALLVLGVVAVAAAIGVRPARPAPLAGPALAAH